MTIRTPNPTQAAGILRGFLKTQGLALHHTGALEAVARLAGYTSYQVMKASEPAEVPKKVALSGKTAEPSLLQQDAPDEFTYVGDGKERVWLTVGSVSVHVGQTDDGVTVDLFAVGCEDDVRAHGRTFMFFDEALEALCDRYRVQLDAVRKWAFEARGAVFHLLPPSGQASLIKDFAEATASTRTESEGFSNLAAAEHDAIAEWVGQHYGKNFDKEPLAKKADWVERYRKSHAEDDEDETPQPRYVHGEWNHLFGFVGSEDTTRFVYDREKNCLIAVELLFNDGTWHPAKLGQREDLQDSLLGANSEVLEAPGENDLEESPTPPQWAHRYLTRE